MASPKKRLLPPTPSTSPDSDGAVPVGDHADAGDNEHDSDAPEMVNLSQTKREVKKKDKEMREIEEKRKAERKERNRMRDRKLKEKAEGRKKNVVEKEEDDDVERGGDESDNGSEDSVRARMERAMKDAEGEMDEDDSDEDDSFSGIIEYGDESDEEIEDEDEDEDEWEDEDESDGQDDPPLEKSTSSSKSQSHAKPTPSSQLKTKTISTPKYLPDDVFTSAFTSTSAGTTKTNKRKRGEEEISKASLQSSNKRRKDKKSKSNDTDIVVGSRVIRTLNSSTSASLPTEGSVLPSKKIKKFLDRTLVLKGGIAKGRGWERKPAHIGVLKTNGPAAHFVRNR